MPDMSGFAGIEHGIAKKVAVLNRKVWEEIGSAKFKHERGVMEQGRSLQTPQW
jgi:hypothetical protein